MSRRHTLWPPRWLHATLPSAYGAGVTSPDVLRDPTPHRTLNAVSECAIDLADLRDPHLLLQAIVRRARALLGTDMAYLSLNDLARGETHIEVTDGVRTQAYRTIRMPLGTGVLGAVAAGGTDVQTRDYLRDPAMNHLDHIDEIVRREGVRAIHGCPVRVGGHVVAALLVAHRTPIRFTGRQVAALRRLAELSAVALAQQGNDVEGSLGSFPEELIALIPAGPAAICDLLSERLDNAVELHTPTLDLDGSERGAVTTATTASRHSGEPVAVAVDGQTVTVLAVAHASDHVATLLVRTDPLVLGERGRLLLARSAPALGAALVCRRLLAESEARIGSGVVEAVMRGEPIDDELTHRLRSQGFGPHDPVTVVVALGGRSVTDLSASLRRATSGGPVLVGGRGLDHVVIAAADDPARLAERVLTVLGGDTLAGWAVAHGLDQLPRAHESARRSARAMRGLGLRHGCADAARLGPVGMLVAGTDPGVVAAAIDVQIGPLLAADAARGSLLAETAWVVLESGGALRNAADRLHIHPNTVRQRCDRIATLIGADWRSAPRSLDVHHALRLWRVRGELTDA